MTEHSSPVTDAHKIIKDVLEPGILGDFPGASSAVALNIIEALEAEGYAVHAQCEPDGWVLVPKEPTDPMCEAMLNRIEDAEAGRGAPFKWPDIEHMFDIYTDAIAARPAVTSTDNYPVKKAQGGAWRKISADEAVKLEAEGANVDWIEGAGFVVYDVRALAETREQAARIAGVTSAECGALPMLPDDPREALTAISLCHAKIAVRAGCDDESAVTASCLGIEPSTVGGS